MTNEEAKGRLESFIDTFNICKEHDNALVDVSIGKEDIQAFTQAIKALEQTPKTWGLDAAREDFMNDVYNTLDFLPTNNEANRIIDSFDRVTSGLEQEPCEDAVSRQAVLDIIMPYCKDDDGSVENTGDLRNALDDIESLSPVVPKEKTEWTPVKYRDMTQEEIEQYSEYTGATKMFDCKMPEDGQEILVSTRGGYVYADTCEIDDMYGIGLENCGDWEDILAWMPMPEPYKEVGK